MTMLSNYVHLHTLICIMIDDIHTYTHLSAHPHTHTHLPTTTNTYHADTHHADTHHAQNAHFAMHTDPKEVTGFGYVVDVVPPFKGMLVRHYPLHLSFLFSREQRALQYFVLVTACLTWLSDVVKRASLRIPLLVA